MLPNFVNVDSLNYMYSCDRVTERRLDQVEEANCEAVTGSPIEDRVNFTNTITLMIVHIA